MRRPLSLLFLGFAALAYACKEDNSPVEDGTGGRLVVTGGTGGTAGTGKSGSGTSGTGNTSGASAGAGGGGAAGAGGGAAGMEPAGPKIVVDSLNVALAGTAVPNAAARRKPIQDAIAAMKSDVLCVQEAWLQPDKDALIAAAAQNFPHHFELVTDNKTAIDDTKDLMGATPTIPTTPACTASMAKFDAAVKCVTDSCSTIPKSEQGYVTDLSCPQANCVGMALPLLSGNADEKRCYGCFAPQLASEKIADIRTSCTTVPNTGLAYGGQSSPMLFSKHPIKNTKAVVLPAGWFRRVILKATVQHPDGDIDVYCHHTNPVYAGFLYPYTGLWGAGPDANPWINENELHAQRAIDFAKSESTTPAIVLGDFNGSPALKDGAGDPIFKPDGVAGFERINKAFPAMQPADPPKFCTFCADNTNIPDADKAAYAPGWLDHVFLKDFPAGSAVSFVRTYDTADIPTKDAMGVDTKVHLTDHYGVRGVILMPKK